MTIKGVIFDHDGTLVDTEKYHFEIWKKILLRYKVDFTFEDYVKHCNGLPTSQTSEFLCEYFTLTADPDQLLEEKLSSAHTMFLEQAPSLMPYACNIIQFCLDRSLKIAIATGTESAMVKASMGNYDFYPHFCSITTNEQVENNKPAPDVYLLALQEMNLHANEVIALEDSATGVASAKAADLLCIAVSNGVSTDLDRADYQVKNLTEAQGIIESFLV